MLPLRLFDDLRRRILVHRRLLGALLAALAVWMVVHATTAPPPPTTPVWTAHRDLPSGTVLARDDLRRIGFAPGSEPETAVDSLEAVVGQTLATPLRRGEPVTGADLSASGRLSGYPGRDAVAVRIPDADVVALLSPGERVALVATDPQGAQPPERIVDDAAVLSIPKPPTLPSATLTGRLVVVAVPAEQVEDLAAAATSRFLTVVWSR